MVEWRDGYVVDLTYAAKAYPELAPASVAAMSMMSGVEPPDLSAPAYLELGFGQGLSLALAAAAHPGRYQGIDFIPEHVANAHALGVASGANFTVSPESMTKFADAPGGEDFDLITLHGVWSWVDDAARAAITRILKRRLRPGGIALISYNTPAGWAPLDPLRQLYIRFAAASGLPPAEAMSGGIAYATELAGLGGKYFQNTPAAQAELDRIAQQDPHYLVHELLNEGHRTFSFAETQVGLTGADLTYIGPARFAEYIDRRRLKTDAMAVIERFADPNLQEMARDLMQAQRFRSDLYVKGPARPMTAEAVRQTLHFTLIKEGRPPMVERGAQAGFQALANQVFDALADDGARSKSLEELTAACPGVGPDRIALAVMALAALHACAPVAPGGHEAASAQALNRALAEKVLEGGDGGLFASPVTGAWVPVRPVVQMLLAARAKDPNAAPRMVQKALRARGEAVVQAGAPVTDAAQSLRILSEMAGDDDALGLPRLRRLGAID